MSIPNVVDTSRRRTATDTIAQMMTAQDRENEQTAKRLLAEAGVRLRAIEDNRDGAIRQAREALDSAEAAGIDPQQFFRLMGMKTWPDDKPARLARRIIREHQARKRLGGIMIFRFGCLPDGDADMEAYAHLYIARLDERGKIDGIFRVHSRIFSVTPAGLLEVRAGGFDNRPVYLLPTLLDSWRAGQARARE